MYTYVAPISVFWDAILRLTEQILAVPDGYREDVLGAFHSVSADGFRLQDFFGREQLLFSSCASNVHNVGPPRVFFRVRQPFEALSEFDAIILVWVDPSRPKSTQVDVSRRDFFFLDFFLDFADGSSSRFRQPHEVHLNSLQLPWVRAGCDGL